MLNPVNLSPATPTAKFAGTSLNFEVKNTEGMNATQQVQLSGKMTSFSTALPGLNALAAQRPDQAHISVEVSPQGDFARITPAANPSAGYQLARTYYESFSDFLYRLVQS